MKQEKQIVFIDKNMVIENYLFVVNKIKQGLDNNFVMFGFYFNNEYMDVDLTIEISELDIITNFIRNRAKDDLMFYYMMAPFLNKEYVFVFEDKYKGLSVEDIQWDMRKLLYSGGNETDILLKLNPTWYNDDFDRTSYNYSYRGDCI